MVARGEETTISMKIVSTHYCNVIYNYDDKTDWNSFGIIVVVPVLETIHGEVFI